MPKGSTQTRLSTSLRKMPLLRLKKSTMMNAYVWQMIWTMKTENGVMVQDTAWEGYEEIPAWIMQGYGTMAMEANEQLGEYGCDRPTHVFIQAGVGSLAGAVQGYFANRYPENPPKVVVVEAEAAACLYKGAALGDGSIQIVDGDMVTIMAGLACGEPNTISWDILKNHVDTFIASDWVAAKGMRMLAAPIKGDPAVASGESGAAPFGTLAYIMLMDEYKELKEHLGLNKDSKVLLFSTEEIPIRIVTNQSSGWKRKINRT